jgi:hypothetical protein
LQAQTKYYNERDSTTYTYMHAKICINTLADIHTDSRTHVHTHTHPMSGEC